VEERLEDLPIARGFLQSLIFILGVLEFLQMLRGPAC
jgi:hypothetical protein